MKKKINAKFMMISALAVLLTGLCAGVLFFNILEAQIFDDLQTNAKLIEMMNPKMEAKGFSTETEQNGLRITLIAADGTVSFDSFGNENAMENHAGREEIKEALEEGEGRAVRHSATSNKHTFYYAVQTADGTILRIAKDSSSIYTLLVQMVIMIIAVCMVVFGLCIFWSRRLTRRLMLPIEKMADNIVLMEEDVVYEEMRPFVATIKQQHMDILQHAKMRQEFTANVSHELKTPLTAISGYAELIANGMTDEKDTVHFAQEIHRSAERLQNLINDIIKLSELDDGDLQLEFEEVDLLEAAKNCAAGLEIFAEQNEVSIHVEGCTVKQRGDKSLIEELLYNLCSNAIRYNKRGGSVTLLVYIEEGRSVLVVKDTGIGIPKDQQERVFERFYRVDKSRSKSTGGTGLGLAIVKHIVAQHGAKIEMTSEVGVGTEIKVIF